MNLRIAEWAMIKKLSNTKMNDILFLWPIKEKKIGLLVSPPSGVLKFNVDSALRGKLGPTCIVSGLRNRKSEVEILRLFRRANHDMLIIESDSSNAIDWVFQHKASTWKLLFYFSKIQAISFIINVPFHKQMRLVVQP